MVCVVQAAQISLLELAGPLLWLRDGGHVEGSLSSRELGRRLRRHRSQDACRREDAGGMPNGNPENGHGVW